MNFAEQKSKLRIDYRQQRKEHTVKFPYTHLLESPEFQSAIVIASYISHGDEPDTTDLNLAILNSGKKLLLPRINTQSREPSLDWVPWQGDFSQLASRGRLMEPTGDVEERIDCIDVVVIPALQIDLKGFRLGQGGGYYDRALIQLQAWKIALIFPEETSGDLLPKESHDIAVDAYATYKKIVRFT